HETDFTIADFVADVRAPTPTAAAAAAVPDRADLLVQIQTGAASAARSARNQLSGARGRFSSVAATATRLSPQARIDAGRQRLDELIPLAAGRWQTLAAVRRERLEGRRLQLATLDAQATLSRGYSITRLLETGAVVKQTHQVSPGDPLEIQVSDGSIPAAVQESKIRKEAGQTGA
ncbi:MAG: exodeoxyribonuclease VII large subunit, partial [Anaerolineae bacterium]